MDKNLRVRILVNSNATEEFQDIRDSIAVAEDKMKELIETQILY